ncbi:MAG: hypothetical protein HZY74_06840 [Brevundimonas sp.]|nr:MAG: hypothetical protein HZY74_06840 [Brevundimonas sp.]
MFRRVGENSSVIGQVVQATRRLTTSTGTDFGAGTTDEPLHLSGSTLV